MNTDFIKKNWTKIIFALFVFILITRSYFVYKNYTKKYDNTPNKENGITSTTSNQNVKNAQIILWYANWCPHCRASKPAWDSVQEKYDNKVVNGYLLEFIEVDCTKETPEVEKSMDKYKIEGFPTIKLIKDDSVINFDAKPSYDTLNQFINSVL